MHGGKRRCGPKRKGYGKADGKGKGTWDHTGEKAPTRKLPPTHFEVTPIGFLPAADLPCYVILANWQDGMQGDAGDQFLTDFNVVLVVRAAGLTRDYRPANPQQYGVNKNIRRQPEFIDLPINHHLAFTWKWQGVVLRIHEAWRGSKYGKNHARFSCTATKVSLEDRRWP